MAFKWVIKTRQKCCLHTLIKCYYSAMTRILLYSSEPILAQGLSSVLAGNADLRLIGVSNSTDNLGMTLETEKPDVLLLDLTSDMSFQLLRELKKRSDTCKMLLWVNAISTELAFQAMGLGVRGIVRKTLPAETLIE